MVPAELGGGGDFLVSEKRASPAAARRVTW